jgi:hypothetical protein
LLKVITSKIDISRNKYTDVTKLNISTNKETAVFEEQASISSPLKSKAIYAFLCIILTDLASAVLPLFTQVAGSTTAILTGGWVHHCFSYKWLGPPLLFL